MQSNAPKTRKSVTKACDACRRRKTKCNGSQPCAGCLSANLACTFVAPRGQGGNHGPRATVLNQLRANPQNDAVLANLQDVSPTTATTAAVNLTQSVFEAFISVYKNRIYRTVSLLPVDKLRKEAAQMLVSPTSRQLIFAFCAYIANFGDFSNDVDWEPVQSAQINPQTYYLDHAMLSLQRDRVIQRDTRSIYISFFLYGAYAGRGDYRQAWFYLRESTTLYMMLKDEDRDWLDTKTRTHLFWILVVSERYAGSSIPFPIPPSPLVRLTFHACRILASSTSLRLCLALDSEYAWVS
jgi:SP family general alpha glucoside:H+ symporter-like MFS transporter